MKRVTWRLRKTYETNTNIVTVDACGNLDKITITKATGNTLTLDMPTLCSIIDDLVELGAVKDYRENVLRPLKVTRKLLDDLKVPDDQQSKALTLIHIIDNYIDSLEQELAT